jgi:hypothetical protein
VHAARKRKRPMDLSDIEVVGKSIDEVASPHQYDFPYTEDKSLPLSISEMGIKGLAYYKYDLSLCTYCSGLTRTIFYAIAKAWQDKPWEDVEVLSGKVMQPSAGKKKTILFGKCMYQAHKDNADIREMIPIKGCPPKPDSIVKAFHQAGIDVDPNIFKNIGKLPGNFFKRYAGRPEFEESHFQIR